MPVAREWSPVRHPGEQVRASSTPAAREDRLVQCLQVLEQRRRRRRAGTRFPGRAFVGIDDGGDVAFVLRVKPSALLFCREFLFRKR